MTNFSSCFKIFMVCIFLTSCTECTKNWVHPDIKYYFLQGVNINPVQKIYKRLDTIRIEITVPGKYLFDTLSKTRIQTDSISLPVSLIISNINNGQPGTTDGY